MIAAELSGHALHSGVPSNVRVERRKNDGAGLRFFWPGWNHPLVAEDLIGLRRAARRATVLEDAAGNRFGTPEHLLAASLFFAHAPLDVACDASEPPCLDGSARPFYDLLARAAPECVAAPRWREYDSELEWEHSGPEGSLRASPAENFSVEYSWGPRNQRVGVSAAGAVPGEILPARTFIFYRDWIALSGTASAENPLLSGAREDSGLLLAETPEEFARARAALPGLRGTEFPLLHPEAFRLDAEPVRHKVLDLLGDLALLGLALPRLRLEIRDGGHALNHLLLERLHHERRQRHA